NEVGSVLVLLAPRKHAQPASGLRTRVAVRSYGGVYRRSEWIDLVVAGARVRSRTRRDLVSILGLVSPDSRHSLGRGPWTRAHAHQLGVAGSSCTGCRIAPGWRRYSASVVGLLLSSAADV